MKQLKIGFDYDDVILFWLCIIRKETIEILNQLRSQGHEILVVTARGNVGALWHANKMAELYRLNWLEIVGVGPNGDKYKKLKRFDFYFDNKIEQLGAIAKNLTGEDRVRNLFLFGEKPKGGFENVANWQQIYSKIEKEQ
ncbi:MAG: hypothetical protein Q7R99_01010 [bacterium]|nr:hypothetical protein [bacterium]